MIGILLAWTALAAFEDRMFADAVRMATEPHYTHRWIRMMSFVHLGWTDSLVALLQSPRTRAETLLLADALIQEAPPRAIPLIRPYLRDTTLGDWAVDRMVQVFLQEERPWDALVFYTRLPDRRRAYHLPRLLEHAEALQDTDLVFALLADMERFLPSAALFWWGVMDTVRRKSFWDSLLVRYPESVWAQRAFPEYSPSRRARVQILLAQSRYREVLRRTRNPREPWEAEARFLAYYRRDRYTSAVRVFLRYRRLFRELPPERTFQALIAAYYARPRAYPGILQDLLARRDPRTTDQAAHLTAHFLFRNPRFFSRVAPLARRYRSGVLAFQLGLVTLTRQDTASARTWFQRALKWARTDFDRDQAAFWLARIGQGPSVLPVWISYYRWVREEEHPPVPRFSLSPPVVLQERWLWAARLGEPWMLRGSRVPPWAWKDLAAEAHRWGWTPLALRWAYRYAQETGQWEDVISLLFPRPYRREVCAKAQRYGVDPALIWAVMREESHFQPSAVSPAGAVGLMQLMPFTAQRVLRESGLEGEVTEPLDLTDPTTNIAIGVAHLSRLLAEFPHVWAALAAYNAGRKHARRWLRIPATDPLLWVEWIGFRETRNYVRKVYRSFLIYQGMERSRSACSTGL